MGLVVSTVTTRAEVHRRRGRGGENAETTDPFWPVSAPRSEVRDERWGPALSAFVVPKWSRTSSYLALTTIAS